MFFESAHTFICVHFIYVYMHMYMHLYILTYMGAIY